MGTDVVSLNLKQQLGHPGTAHGFGRWYALVVDEGGNKVEDGYLGAVGGEGYPADDDADHYGVDGCLAYARGWQKNEARGVAPLHSCSLRLR